MQISVCDYCLLEGKVVETITKITISSNMVIAGCKKHEKILVNDVSTVRTSKEFGKIASMVSKNLLKRGKVLAGLKKGK